jgi:membrane fusion protein (multidrug efflux system)
MNAPESLVNHLAKGVEIPVTIDALGETRTGKISSITPYGATASRTYPVRVSLSDEGGRLKVGMSTTAVFPAGRKHRRITVSRDAVLIKPDGATVWVVRPGEPMTAVPVPVDVVARVGERFAVSAQNRAGRRLLVGQAKVVVEGAERLRPNQAVRLLEARAAQADGDSPARNSGGAPAGAASKPVAAGENAALNPAPDRPGR